METPGNDVITPEQAGNLHGLFVERARRTPDKVAYRYFQQDAWRDITWQGMLGEVARERLVTAAISNPILSAERPNSFARSR